MSKHFYCVVLLLSYICIHQILCLRTNDGSDPLVPDYHDKYYYLRLKDKMTESMSINNCTMYGIGKVKGISASRNEADLTVRELKPPVEILNRWKKNAQGSKLFVKATPNLCISRQFRDFKRGIFKRAKGCYEMYIIDRKGEKLKRINRYGATLHPDHIRCDVPSSVSVCIPVGSSSSGLVEVNPKFRDLHNFPFIVEAKNVIVAKSGMLALPCGPFGLLSSCEAVKWGVSTAASVMGNTTICRNTPELCPYKTFSKVFLMSQYDDTQIGQFMMESFPRLVFHLEYLRANPDIKIHFGFTKQPTVPKFVLPHIFINWLGLQDRLINGTFYANEVIMSREGGCQDAGYNSWELVTMRDKFLKISNVSSDDTARVGRASVLIIVRSTSSFFVQNKFSNNRNWPPGTLTVLQKRLATLFPNHNIKLFRDSNATLMRCPDCQIRLFNEAEVVIAMHGAGMTNNMYMRPGGVVVEVVPEFDSRHAPLVGIFPRLSGIMGLHHYTYYIKGVEFDPVQLALDTADYYNKVKLWTEK